LSKDTFEKVVDDLTKRAVKDVQTAFETPDGMDEFTEQTRKIKEDFTPPPHS